MSSPNNDNNNCLKLGTASCCGNMGFCRFWPNAMLPFFPLFGQEEADGNDDDGQLSCCAAALICSGDCPVLMVVN